MTVLISLRVIRDGSEVLLNLTPRDADLDKIRDKIKQTPGVTDVHDLHCWYQHYGEKALSMHIIINQDHQGRGVCAQGVLLRAQMICIREGILHTTIQVEDPEHSPEDHIQPKSTAFCVTSKLAMEPSPSPYMKGRP